MYRFHWNTGNLYTIHGQRIGAVMCPDGTIVFCDLDRIIFGTIPPDYEPHLSVKERVLFGYMYGNVQYWVYSHLGFESFSKLKKEALKEAQLAPSIKKD